MSQKSNAINIRNDNFDMETIQIVLTKKIEFIRVQIK